MVTAAMKLKHAYSLEGKLFIIIIIFLQRLHSSDLFLWAPKSLQTVTAAMKLKDAYSLEEKL